MIQNGVQAIDDKFLEWFVKNPSCEEVEIKSLLSDNGNVLKNKQKSAGGFLWKYKE